MGQPTFTYPHALASFRYSVGSIIPGMTRVPWQLKKDSIVKEVPGATRKKFLFNLARSSYEREWGTKYHRPGFRTRVVTWLLKLVPKSGLFRSLAFRSPTPEVEKMFMAPPSTTTASFWQVWMPATSIWPTGISISAHGPRLASTLGADLAYDKLLDKLADRKFAGVKADLRQYSFLL